MPSNHISKREDVQWLWVDSCVLKVSWRIRLLCKSPESNLQRRGEQAISWTLVEVQAKHRAYEQLQEENGHERWRTQQSQMWNLLWEERASSEEWARREVVPEKLETIWLQLATRQKLNLISKNYGRNANMIIQKNHF